VWADDESRPVKTYNLREGKNGLRRRLSDEQAFYRPHTQGAGGRYSEVKATTSYLYRGTDVVAFILSALWLMWYKHVPRGHTLKLVTGGVSPLTQSTSIGTTVVACSYSGRTDEILNHCL